MRARSVLVALGLLVATVAASPVAHAQEADDHSDDAPPTVQTGPEGSVTIGDGIFLTGMVITPLDGGEPRTLDATQAAAMSQAVIAQAYWGPPGIQKDPPADLPVYRIEISGDFNGDVGVLTIHYADDGTDPYVAFPGLVVTPEAQDPPPAPENWFTVPIQARKAFEGTATVVETSGVTNATATTAPPESAAADEDSSDSSSVVPIVAGVAIALALVAALVWLLRRRGGKDDVPDEDTPGGDDDPMEEVTAAAASDR